MARPTRQTLGAVGVATPIVLNNMNGGVPFAVGFAVDVSAGGTLTYSVEHTFDDVFANAFNPATATWFPHASIAAQTADKDGNYAFPVMAIRLNVTAWSAGTATFTVIQQG